MPPGSSSSQRKGLPLDVGSDLLPTLGAQTSCLQTLRKERQLSEKMQTGYLRSQRKALQALAPNFASAKPCAAVGPIFRPFA